FSSRRRHTRFSRDWSSDVCSSDLHDLKDYWSFLAARNLDWREVRLEDVGEFVAWLRLPPAARDGRVTLLSTVQAHVGAATVNRRSEERRVGREGGSRWSPAR